MKPRISIFSIILILLLTLNVYAEKNFNKKRESTTDAFEELGGLLTLRFFDALTGDPIEDGMVKITRIGTYMTDYEGRVRFEPPEDVEFVSYVTFSKTGYITSRFKLEINLGTIIFNRFSISPKMPLGYLRVVLDWGEKPKDLDAHLKKIGEYHISYRNMHEADDGRAMLDRDDVTSFGPETITVKEVDEAAVYHYFIHDYTNRRRLDSKRLSKSHASIKVYGGDNQLLQVFTVPEDIKGRYWHVFSVQNDKIMPVNKIIDREP